MQVSHPFLYIKIHIHFIELDVQEEKHKDNIVTSPTCVNIFKVVMPFVFIEILYFKMSI